MTDPTQPKFSDDADDAEGHVYINPDADIAGRPDQAVTSPGPDGEDTEGHRVYYAADDQPGPQPEGFRLPSVTDDGDDTEGHRIAATDDGDDDTEGHRVLWADGESGPAPEGIRVRVTDDGDDTEGHRVAQH